MKLSEPGNHVNGFKQQKIEALKFLSRSKDMKDFDLILFGRIHSGAVNWIRGSFKNYVYKMR